MAGISGPRGGASHSRLSRVADPYASRMGEALWQTRLRWRLRGAMMWPAFAAAVVVEAVLLDRLPVAGDRGPGLVRRRAARGLRQPDPRRGRRAAGRALAAPPSPRDAIGDRDGPRGGRAHRGGRGAGGDPRPAAPLERAGRERGPRRPGGISAALLHQPGAARVPGQRRTTSTPSSRATTSTAPASPSHDSHRAFCVFVNTDQSPPGVTRDPDQRPNAAGVDARSPAGEPSGSAACGRAEHAGRLSA